jgi:hypothetical protein
MAVTKIKPIKSTLKKALDYIQNPNKTDGKMLVSSFGCSYETADIEFGFTLSQALDRGNNLAHHLIQSFEPGEVDYEKAHEIGKQLADAVTKGQYEYVLTTHIDKGHIHNHIIFSYKLCRLPQVCFQQAHLLRNTQHQRQAVPGKRLVRPCAGERRQGKELCGV